MLERFLAEAVPSVFVNRRHVGSGRNVVMRAEDAAQLAADYLLELGHRRLARLSGPDELDTGQRRRVAFVEAVRSAGLEPVVESAAFDEYEAMHAVQRLLERTPRPTAVFVSNVNQAVGASAAARMAGVSIPRDLSLVTYDDDPVVEYLETPLTTIRMPL